MSITSPERARPERADAARNREIILATARRLFAERGIGVTLNEIAHDAGVGVGTVYRKFPDKTSLIEALLEAKFATLSLLADEALSIDDPAESLRAYLRGAFELRVRDRAMADVIVRGAKSAPSVVRARTKVDATTTAIVMRAVADGSVRPGFDARDIPILVMMLGEVADRTKSIDPEAWCRYAQFLTDAVCPPAELRPLHGEPLDMAEIHRALSDPDT